MPDWKPALSARLTPLSLTPAREREIFDELAQHLDDLYQERRTAGIPHEEAVRAALAELDEHDLLLREMTPLAQVRRHHAPPPGAGGRHWLADLRQDLPYAVRTLRQAPGWTGVIVLLLALGIGVNTALFTATDGLLLAPLPVHEPDDLVRLRWAGPNDAITQWAEYGFTPPLAGGERVGASFSFQAFSDLADAAQGSAELFAAAPFSQVTAIVDGHAELVTGLGATGNYFSVLGIRTPAGRLFTAEDDHPAAPPVAVISWRFWQSRFGGDPSAIGRSLLLNGVAVTIVGVTPAGFAGTARTLDTPPDITFPLSLDRVVKASSGPARQSLLANPTAWWLQVMGRLGPGVTAPQLEGALDGVLRATAGAGLRQYLESLTDEQRGTARNQQRREVPRLLVDAGRQGLYGADATARTSAVLLDAVVVAVLLIVCANVGNLILSRALNRRREVAVRLSLGATRSRLIRQFLTEAFVLASLGAAGGLAIAAYGIRLLPAPLSSAPIFGARTLAFTALAVVVTTLLFGTAPAVRATGIDVNEGLKDSGRSLTGRRSLLARGLLITQVALSLVLLVSAGLFLQSLQRLRQVDFGFDPQDLLLVQLAATSSGYDLSKATALYHDLLERFGALPGASGVALSTPGLLAGAINSTDIYVQDAPDSEEREIYQLRVSSGFFDVMRLPVVRGRALTDRDNEGGPRVALINETAARRFFGHVDPIGSRFGSQPDRTGDVEVVGIVRDASYEDVRSPVPPTMYLPYRQSAAGSTTFALRIAGDTAAVAASVRAIVRQVDPTLPVAGILTQTEQIDRRLAQEKLFARAYTLFGGIAVLLTGVGLFGLMSYNIARRRAEMGIRLALGARQGQIVGMVMRESLALVAIGLAAGLGLTFASGRLIASQLFDVHAHDALTITAALLFMSFVTAAAAWLPASRASRVDPNVALRYD